MTAHDVRTSDGALLHVETLGDGGAPLVLLGGSTWSKDWWDDDLCGMWVAAGWWVVRYDQRDTGASTSYPVGEPGYGQDEMVGDVVAILDHLGVAAAHLAGLSAGGGLAQVVAAKHRDRVASLTLMSTSPADPGVRDLPGPTPAILDLLRNAQPGPDWTDRGAVVEFLVEAERPYAGPGSFDEEVVRRAVVRSVERDPCPASALTNHFLLAPGADVVTMDELDSCPTLVVHGTADPLFPVEHGRALAAAVPGARLLELVDVGHQLPPRRDWPALVEAMTALRAAA